MYSCAKGFDRSRSPETALESTVGLVANSAQVCSDASQKETRTSAIARLPDCPHSNFVQSLSRRFTSGA